MLLLHRSTCYIAVFLFYLKHCHVSGQQYDGEYDEEDHSSYEESDGPDYSKYYSVDGGSSSPLVDGKSEAGFVNPADFSSFFSPSFYAASNKKEIAKDVPSGFVNPEFQSGFGENSPFGSKDYFEEAAQRAKTDQPQADAYELKPGPSYVSHRIVSPTQKKSKYELEIDDLNQEYNGNKDAVIPLKPKIVDPKYLPQYTPQNPNNLTPYQKYSFQPPTPATLSTFASATAGLPVSAPTSFEYLYKPASENHKYPSYATAASNVKQNLEKYKDFQPAASTKQCKKINKHVPGSSKNSKPMDCYVCKNANGASYEECFFGQTSESNPKNYYIETSKEYTEPTQVQNFNFNRYKRYTVNRKDDPYEYLKKESEKYYNSPDHGSSYKHPKSYEDDYKFGGGGDGNEEISSSEQISAELAKSPDNCQQVVKDGMHCTVCVNKKSGGNYEQCSYTTAPEEKKYAYKKERIYSSDDENPTEETDSSEEHPTTNRKPQQFYEQPKKSKKQRNQQQRSPSRSTPKVSDADGEEVERIKPINTHRHASEYTIPKHFANIQVSPASGESEEEQSDHEDYYYQYFPPNNNKNNNNGAETKRDEQQQDPNEDHEAAEEEPQVEDYGYYGEESKKDVEEVLAEFAKKDRSRCKKAEKNGMTCYLCLDKKGLQHEECMYVSESRPQSTYQAYHAQKETDQPEKQKEQQQYADESKVKSVARTRRGEPQAAGSNYPEDEKSVSEIIAKIKDRGGKKPTDDKKHSKKEESRKESSADFDEPPAEESNDQYRVDGEQGAFSHETEPVYSKQFGTTLPKFMLTKSEGELLYDEFTKSKS